MNFRPLYSSLTRFVLTLPVTILLFIVPIHNVLYRDRYFLGKISNIFPWIALLFTIYNVFLFVLTNYRSEISNKFFKLYFSLFIPIFTYLLLPYPFRESIVLSILTFTLPTLLIYFLIRSLELQKSKILFAISLLYSGLKLSLFIWFLVTNYEQKVLTKSLSESLKPLVKEDGNKKPNIYHLIFDDISFLQTSPEALKRDENFFSGFNLYSNAITNYGYTRGALSAITRGTYHGDSLSSFYEPMGEFSFFRDLSQQDYRLLINTEMIHYPKAVSLNFNDFEYENLSKRRIITSDILNLFDLILWSHYPFLGNPELFYTSIRKVPIQELTGFKDFLKEESKLASTGLYYLLYFNIPHPPFNLKSDCSYDEYFDYQRRIGNSNCMFVMIKMFIDHLKSIDRYKKSIVVIHSDHGSMQPGMRHRPLFFYKPNDNQDIPLNINDSVVTITDIGKGLVEVIKDGTSKYLPNGSDTVVTDKLKYFYPKNYDFYNDLHEYKINPDDLSIDYVKKVDSEI